MTTSFSNKRPLGNENGVYRLLSESLQNRLEITSSLLIGYVLMPSHIHLILFIDGKPLTGFIRDFKKYTAQKSLANYSENGKLWQDRYDRQALNSIKTLITKLNYIHTNPVRVGLVKVSTDWFWSSAKDYYTDGLGPLPVWKGWA